ncbi:hypothetical protein Gohar_021190, partial [Gossypium harknessii]|nr:hypothetical protein [Gossypium harknessii]
MLNLTPWLFDQSLFPLFPFVKGQEMDDYEFNITPFWIRIYNIPFEQMDREVAIDVGKAIGEVVAIDWHDRNGRWTEYIRIRVKIDVLRPLRRVVHLVGSEGTETLGGPTQARGNRRNGIEILEKKINPREETNGNKDGNGEENDLTMPKGKDKARVVEEESESCSPMEKRLTKTTRDGMAVNSEGRSGGLALLWKDGVDVSIQNYSR